MTRSIPFIIHQTWRDVEIPVRWRKFQCSWRDLHPEWEYRLWTDLELRQLVREHYPWFLSIYDNYPEHIQRVDAARYFILHRYGGIYADLDVECLKPFQPLLERHELILASEPEAHLSKAVVKSHGMEMVLGNALMVSRPGHPFWAHVFLELVGAHGLPGPLTTTGPFFLTRAWQGYADPDAITCLPAATFYPGSSDEAEKGLLQEASWRLKHAADSLAIHHWSGSWIERKRSGSGGISVPFTFMSGGKRVAKGDLQLPAPEPVDRGGRDTDLVSCLLVTRSARLSWIRRSIACFQAQTYSRVELVVIDDSLEEDLVRYVESLSDPRIRLIRITSQGLALGALRNLAVSHAAGKYVMQWDDDDLHHPCRIETQMAALNAFRADACFLSRWRIWWPGRLRLAVSKRRCWEGSVLCAKEKLPPYDDNKRRGEDTPVALRLASRERVVLIDSPQLYTYVVHGGNTTPEVALSDHWAQATEFCWGVAYSNGLRALANEFPPLVSREIIADSENRGEVIGADSRTRIPEPCPRILILSPVKDGLPFIKRYLEGIDSLDYPAHQLSLALLESDSQDGTFDALSSQLQERRSRFGRLEIFKRDFQFRLSANRAAAAAQLQRRSILARSRNHLLSRGLQDEEWVLWLDFDLIEYPADLIQLLLSAKKEIVVPHCVLAPGGRTFDLNTFIRKDGESVPTDSGRIVQPARGVGRRYLEECRDRDLLPVDCVGGTALLVKADLHRDGLVFPVAPYRQHIETEGFALLARDMGIRCWGMPNVEVVHANR